MTKSGNALDLSGATIFLGIRNLMEGNTGKPYIRAHSQNGCCWDHNSLDGCIAPGGMLKNEKG